MLMSCFPFPPPPTQEKDGGMCHSMSHRGTGNMGAPDTCLLGATPDAASRGRRRRRGRRMVGMFACVCERERDQCLPDPPARQRHVLDRLQTDDVRNEISHLVATTQPRQQVTRQNIHPPGALVLDTKGKQDLIVEVAVVVPPPLLPVHRHHIKHLRRLLIAV